MLTFYLSLIENHEDDDDFLNIYYQYRRSMYNIAFSYLQDYHYSHDAMQIAFTGIAKNIGTIKKLDEEKLEIYVLKSIKNASISILEDKNMVCKNVHSIDDLYNDLASDDNILESAMAKELLNEIFAFIETLDEKYRDVLSLYYLQELNFREIAMTLHKPVSTVKDRFKKGHKLILEKFKEYRK